MVALGLWVRGQAKVRLWLCPASRAWPGAAAAACRATPRICVDSSCPLPESQEDAPLSSSEAKPGNPPPAGDSLPPWERTPPAVDDGLDGLRAEISTYTPPSVEEAALRKLRDQEVLWLKAFKRAQKDGGWPAPDVCFI